MASWGKIKGTKGNDKSHMKSSTVGKLGRIPISQDLIYAPMRSTFMAKRLFTVVTEKRPKFSHCQ